MDVKKLLLLGVLLLAGCNPFDDGQPDHYETKKTLMPSEVVELHKVCKSQPNYDTSWVISRKGEAKGVMCRYRDADYTRTSNTYCIDAEILRIKIQEGIIK